MAFYSARVDETGREIERRLTAPGGVTAFDWNSYRSYCSTNENLKFVNSTVYVRKIKDESDTSSDNNSLRRYQMSADHNSSVLVPPLDLSSEMSYRSTTRMEHPYPDSAYPKLKNETAQLVLKPDASYMAWLDTKRKSQLEDLMRRKLAEKEAREARETRKRTAEAKFQEWLELKMRQQKRTREALKANHELSVQQTSQTEVLKKESQEKLLNWERVKQLELKSRRILKKQEEKRRIEMEEQRRQMAAKAWENWLAHAKNKPKPVPLNRGVFTLRGTISDIYINPNEWITTAEN